MSDIQNTNATCYSQVQKSELIVGARMGGDSWELDELEVLIQCTASLHGPLVQLQQNLIPALFACRVTVSIREHVGPSYTHCTFCSMSQEVC